LAVAARRTRSASARGVAIAVALVVSLVAVEAEAHPRRARRRATALVPRPVAVAAAVVPGVAARGLGSYLAGDPAAARATLTTGGAGLGLMLLGGLPLLVTYGSGKLVVPGVHLAVVGAGLFVGSWWSDVFAAAGGARLEGRPRAVPPLEVGASATWLREAYRGDRALVGATVRGWRGRWRGAATIRVADDRALTLGRLDGGAVVRGARGGTGSAVVVRGALAGEWRGAADARVATGELAARGRLAFADLAAGLAGSFLEVEAGLGLELVDYPEGEADLLGLLLARFAWGVYLPDGRGEVALTYDHRRDHLAGGLVAGRAAGFFGSLGLSGEVALGGWTATADVEVGSAWVTTVGVRRRLR
jgi:hypothetical protein